MKNINWLDHIANLLVVILGISIAFYLENYKEEKASKRQEKKYIESLIEDLETDIETLDTLIQVNDLIKDAIVVLSDAATGASVPGDSIAFKLLNVQYNPPFEAQRTTYESLKSSGKMDLITDFSLRNNIVELYEQYYRGTQQYDDVIDQNLRDFFKPFYMKNIVFTGRFKVDNSFLRSSEFRNIIFAYRFLFISKSDFYKDVRDQTQVVHDELVAYKDSI